MLNFSAFVSVQNVSKSPLTAFIRLTDALNLWESHICHFLTCLCIPAEALAGHANNRRWRVHAREATDGNGVPCWGVGTFPLPVGCKGRWKKWQMGQVSCLCYWDLTEKRWKLFKDENLTNSQPDESSSELTSQGLFTVLPDHSSSGSLAQEKHQVEADFCSLTPQLIVRRAPVAHQMTPHSLAVPRAHLVHATLRAPWGTIH